MRFTELRYWHSPQSTPPLAETWELPSLSRLACTPYYKHPRCKIVQCSRTPLCWTYGSTAGTRVNPCVTVLPLASTSGTRNTQHHHWLGPDCRVRTPTLMISLRYASSNITTYYLLCTFPFAGNGDLLHGEQGGPPGERCRPSVVHLGPRPTPGVELANTCVAPYRFYNR